MRTRTPASRPRLTAGWLAAFAMVSVPAAWSLTLGEPRSLTAPGQPLHAEVPLRDWGRTPIGQIQVRLAGESAWRAAGLAPIQRDQIVLRIEAQAAGPVLRIESLTPVTTETLDLLLELQWPQGRLVRELGLLIGTLAERQGSPRLLVPSVLVVQPGDVAGALALSHLDPQAELAQALVALARANPQAFVDGNVNRLKAGAVLKLPGAEEIRAIDAQQAQQMVAQQIEAFALYRAQLATQSGAAPEDATQVATGKVQPVQREVPSDRGDRLTLSTPGADDTDRIAEKKQAQQAAERAAEINRNIQDLNRLVQAGESAGLPAPVPESVPARASERIEALSQSPYTPWAALVLVLSLVLWVLARATRRDVSSLGSSPSTVEAGHPPLKVDFDLELPAADTLPPLPEQLQVPPTPVSRSASPVALPASLTAGVRDPMAGLSLDLNESIDDTDPHQLRLELARALWARGLTHTALVLAREVMQQAPTPWSEQARQWLNEHA